MYAHVHSVFLAHRHDCGKEIPHVFAECVAVYAFVQGQQVLEDVHRVLVALFDVAVDESLCLYDDRVDEAFLLGFGNGFVQFLHFGELFRGIVFFRSFTLEDAEVEIGKTHPVEVER